MDTVTTFAYVIMAEITAMLVVTRVTVTNEGAGVFVEVLAIVAVVVTYTVEAGIEMYM